MEVTGWPEQSEALAATVNGEATEAPAAGLLTVIPEEEVEAAVDPVELEELDELEEPALVEPEFVEPGSVEAGFVAALAALVAAEPPQPVPAIAKTTSKERAIEKFVSSFKAKILKKVVGWS